jgi:hypothetical protein
LPALPNSHLLEFRHNKNQGFAGIWIFRGRGKVLPNKGIWPRGARSLALAVAASALTAGWLLAGTAKPAHAEFEIQEAEVQKGEVQVEYRGAVHWGFPATEEQEAGAGEGALEDEEEAPLRQSHDLETQWSVTDRWMVSATFTADQPLGENFETSAVEFEVQYELIEPQGKGLDVALHASYGLATRGGNADEIEFGPIIDYEVGKLALTLNPFLTAQVGENKQTDGLGFQYGWRAEYEVAQNWGLGVEMFGEIEDLTSTGPFESQNHSIGPTLFYNPGKEDENVGGEGDDDDAEKKKEGGGPADMEFSLNVGVQFGLTDATSDTALKFQGELDF